MQLNFDINNKLGKENQIQMAKSQNSKLGKWNKTEHDRFMKALQKYGKNWGLIQKAVSTRTLAQVRSHAQKMFLSMTKEELKSFQGELNHRFESFCNLQKNREDIIEKKNESKTHSSQNGSTKSLEDIDQFSEMKVDSKANENQIKVDNKLIENGLNTLESQKTQTEIRSQGIVSSKCLNFEMNPINIGEMSQGSSFLGMGYLQPPQYGFYLVPSPNFIWMPY